MANTNYNIDLKKVFLSFAQQLFAESPTYTWNEDPKKTKILIVDKNVVELRNVQAKRSIVLSRGTLGWQYTSMGQREKTELFKDSNEQYTDILQGAMIYNCIAQKGIVAEKIAHYLFSRITAHKKQFRNKGILKINNLSIGEESIIKSSSNAELFNVQVFVRFESGQTIYTGYDVYENFYIEDDNGEKYYQGMYYDLTSASGISFYTAPTDGLTLTAHYVNAITLKNETETLIGAVDGSNTDFWIPNAAYSEYPILSGYDEDYSIGS